jgi:uncharacterized membrane protein
MKVSPKRHLAKTITWRLIGTIDTIILSWIITGQFTVGLAIGGVEVISKMILYFLHERVWYRYIKYGLVKVQPELPKEEEVVEQKPKRLVYTKKTN